ncbi:hypothetical protein CALCODRAFT_512810 [Calocera cornea HHB12733]|uniref:Uncharacterized protein n=1 Tax=Calocera cornea HHB12733 TaxID=1353952 RepID=A0A165CRL7_9BASI|nr:hypothetical protein CALCODRAFT_512810 [Calocera cornea HHB12733]
MARRTGSTFSSFFTTVATRLHTASPLALPTMAGELRSSGAWTRMAVCSGRLQERAEATRMDGTTTEIVRDATTSMARPSDWFFQDHDWDQERVLEEVAKLEQSTHEDAARAAGQPENQPKESLRGTMTQGRGSRTALRAARPRNVFYGHPAPRTTRVSPPAGRIATGHDSNDPFVLSATGQPYPVQVMNWDLEPERARVVGYRRLVVTGDMLEILHSRTKLLDDRIIDLFGHLFEEGEPPEWFEYVSPAGLPSVRIISPQALAELPYIRNDPELLTAWFDRHFSHVFPREVRHIHGLQEANLAHARARLKSHPLGALLGGIRFKENAVPEQCEGNRRGQEISRARQVVGLEDPGWAGWQYVDVDVVQQRNSWDCGLWVVMNELSIVRGFPKAPPHDMAACKRAMFEFLAGWPVSSNPIEAQDGQEGGDYYISVMTIKFTVYM